MGSLRWRARMPCNLRLPRNRRSCSPLWHPPWESAVSKKLIPAANAALTTSSVRLSSIRAPKLLLPIPTTVTESEPICRFSNCTPFLAPRSNSRTLRDALARRQDSECFSDQLVGLLPGAVTVGDGDDHYFSGAVIAGDSSETVPNRVSRSNR